MRTTRSVASLRGHNLGPHPLIRHYLERMNFRGIVRDCLGGGLRQGLDHAEVLSVLVHNVLVSRGPMYRIREWAKRIEPSALGLTAAQVDGLNDDRIVRALDALASERGRSVFFRLALRVVKDFELRVPRVHFDTTTVTFSGQYETSVAEPRITHGHNKDHRPDLKQLVFGLDITSDGAVPLLHHIWSGNRTDDSVHVLLSAVRADIISRIYLPCDQRLEFSGCSTSSAVSSSHLARSWSIARRLAMPRWIRAACSGDTAWCTRRPSL
jgi:hypothetical protein